MLLHQSPASHFVKDKIDDRRKIKCSEIKKLERMVDHLSEKYDTGPRKEMNVTK